MSNICPIHQKKYLTLNWKGDKNNLLQCILCGLSDQNGDLNFKIVLEDLLNDEMKLSQLYNWPPLENRDQYKYIQEMFKFAESNFQNENFMNHYVQTQIDEYFEEKQDQILKKLMQIQKEVKIKFENFILKINQNSQQQTSQKPSHFINQFNQNQIRQNIQQYLNGEQNLDNLFNFIKEYKENQFKEFEKQAHQSYKKFKELQQSLKIFKIDMKNLYTPLMEYDTYILQKADIKFTPKSNQILEKENQTFIFKKTVNYQGGFFGEQIQQNVLCQSSSLKNFSYYKFIVNFDFKSQIKKLQLTISLDANNNLDQPNYNQNNNIQLQQLQRKNNNNFLSQQQSFGNQMNRNNQQQQSIIQYYQNKELILIIEYDKIQQQLTINDGENLFSKSCKINYLFQDPVLYISLQNQGIEDVILNIQSVSTIF
ncbi:hypothetical protein PPERSA_02723 [Pseudocohnilembus persalinus]|uniref:Uncharacterized protein n=1 Tax=Pseudocohnilembus persalinus TaxID=266149 RepID=A0A0V0R5V0_PSEPJ|nr:hypothetical protein PPERSA_02723 [Pseudocohnilembus persalinus]|eukprot:KRX09851.1 hypothetical protein PPERSA_02723 [Pseudocohnilembus persalinus]